MLVDSDNARTRPAYQLQKSRDAQETDGRDDEKACGPAQHVEQDPAQQDSHQAANAHSPAEDSHQAASPPILSFLQHHQEAGQSEY